MQIPKIIPNVITSKIGRQILIAQKNSPRLLFVGGLVGSVTSTVLACKATLGLHAVLDDLEYEVRAVKTDLKDTEGYRKDLAFVYAKGAYNITKLYAPAVGLGVVSVSALTGSHVVLTRRNTAVTAAYAATQKAFDDYRERVKAELGEDAELRIKRAIVVEDTIGEDGKKTKVDTTNPYNMSMYARCFDESSRNWQKNPELNRIFVQAQQEYANHLLHARGHVFLNEIYDNLGLMRSKAGQSVGWALGHGGDNYIDFGIFEARNADFVNGWERSIWLDFNVDGVVLDLI